MLEIFIFEWITCNSSSKQNRILDWLWNILLIDICPSTHILSIQTNSKMSKQSQFQLNLWPQTTFIIHCQKTCKHYKKRCGMKKKYDQKKRFCLMRFETYNYRRLERTIINNGWNVQLASKSIDLSQFSRHWSTAIDFMTCNVHKESFKSSFKLYLRIFYVKLFSECLLPRKLIFKIIFTT